MISRALLFIIILDYFLKSNPNSSVCTALAVRTTVPRTSCDPALRTWLIPRLDPIRLSRFSEYILIILYSLLLENTTLLTIT